LPISSKFLKFDLAGLDRPNLNRAIVSEKREVKSMTMSPHARLALHVPQIFAKRRVEPAVGIGRFLVVRDVGELILDVVQRRTDQLKSLVQRTARRRCA